MSEGNQQNMTTAAVEESTFDVETVQMTKQAFDDWEREIQLGIRDTLPDGRKIKDVQAAIQQLQLDQAQAISEAVVPIEKSAPTTLSEVAPDEMVEVTIHHNGAVSATPVIEETEAASLPDEGDGDGEGEGEAENDLPDGLPGREKLIAGGFTSLEIVAKMTLEDLKQVDGIGKATAEGILNYGKSDE